MRTNSPLATIVAIFVLASASFARGQSTSECCSLDLDGDHIVGASDLAAVLGAWGAAHGSAPEDLDDSGIVDAADIALVLGGWGACVESCDQTTISGRVAFADGSAAPGAVIVSELGGSGVSNGDGEFSFVVQLNPSTASLMLTAVATVDGITYTGTRSVDSISTNGITPVGTMILHDLPDCGEELGWLPGFELPGVNGSVFALATFDDGRGTGPALYAGGMFATADGVSASRIARWDGQYWTALKSTRGSESNDGVDGAVYALCVFDDGSGPALYAGGSFLTAGGLPAKRVARWDGVSWSSLGTGPENGTNAVVNTLAVHDDGSGTGPALYVGGAFTEAGGATARRIARWSGTAWSPVGSGEQAGLNGSASAMTVHDDGTGPALYVGGTFTLADGASAMRVAKWDGRAWNRLGSTTVNGVNGIVRSLASFDRDADGVAELYVGGSFSTAGGLAANNIAAWNGVSWSALGSGSANGVNAAVWTMTVLDDPSAPSLSLSIGGQFTTAGGDEAKGIAKWSDAGWSAVAQGPENGVNGGIFAIVSFESAGSEAGSLICGGDFTMAGGEKANRIARLTGTDWAKVGSATGNGVNDRVLALAVYDDGSGPALYAGGSFTRVGSVPASFIAKWDGDSWSALGDGASQGVNGGVAALAVVEEPERGTALYVGGSFTEAGGQPANRIARWDGSTWTPLGNGLNNSVLSIAGHHGTGPLPHGLYVGGSFTMAGDVAASRVARWDGRSWSALGTAATNGVSSSVLALTVFDDGRGAGPGLIAGGTFSTAGGLVANRIARWNGTSWSLLGGGITGGGAAVFALTAFDDGSGPVLIVGGNFVSVSGTPANHIARWDGETWSALASGESNGVDDRVFSLVAVDGRRDRTPTLYVGGEFVSAAGVTSRGVASWSNGAWASMNGGTFSGEANWVLALTARDTGTDDGPSIFAGGLFGIAGTVPSNNLAQWGCVPSNASSGR